MNVFCEDEHVSVIDQATGDEPALQAVATCSRRDGHDGHHCDRTLQVAWTGGDGNTEEVDDCPAGYDHGQPPNRAARRGNAVRTPHAGKRADYRPGFRRPV